MIRGNLILIMVVTGELFAAGAAIAWKAGEPVPPSPDLQRLDPMTAAELNRLRNAARGRSPDHWRELGEGWLAHGALAEAEVAYRRAAELRPDSFDILYAWAFSLERLGRTQEAVERFQQAVVLAPPEMVPTCWYHIGRCFLREEDAVQAEAAFRRVPEFPPAVYQLAKLLIRSGRSEEGLLLLDGIPEPLASALQPLQLRANAERDLDHPEAAAEIRDMAERTVETLPLNDVSDYLTPVRQRFGPSRRIASCYQDGEGRQSAIADCLGTLVDEMEFWDARYLIPQVVELQLQLGRSDEALQLIDRYLERNNVTPQILELRGNALSQSGRHDEARVLWEREAALRDTASVHTRLADDALRRGEEAAVRHHQAMALHCGGVDAFRRNELQSAIQSLEQALAFEPRQAATWYYLGECRRATKDPASARRAYEQCLELSPSHGRSAERLDRLRSHLLSAAPGGP